MAVRFKGLFYGTFIDPLLSGVRSAVFDLVSHGSQIIDVACGTGSLAFLLAGKAEHVTGIDLDEDIISFASSRSGRIDPVNRPDFMVRDASDLTEFGDKEFDIAVTAMSVHQFDVEVAVKVLMEMKRVAKKVIIADYNFPRPAGLSGLLAYSIERMAKGDHYKNYSQYMRMGGLKHFTEKAGLVFVSEQIRGNGVFIIVMCDQADTK